MEERDQLVNLPARIPHLYVPAWNVSSYYPYPFMDVKEICYTGFWLNSFYLLLLFLLLSYLLIGIDKLLGRGKEKPLIAA